jgi:SagB-type dehydrogenase family enzyme
MAHIKAIAVAVGLIMATVPSWSGAEDLQDIPLPAPRMAGGKPLMQALKERKSSRAFGPKNLPLQVLSDLLWAAFGINRPGSGKRTAPSAMNRQEIEIYALMEDGAYLYDARANRLEAVAKGDLRKLAGTQEFVARAPLNLIYVADMTKMSGASAENQTLYSAADTGFISQNVYLFCASEGLATVVRGSVDREALSKALKLSAQKKIMLAQTVGYQENEGQ